MLHKARQYTSDLKNEKQWEQILNLLPERKGAGRPITLDMKEGDTRHFLCGNNRLPVDKSTQRVSQSEKRLLSLS